MTGSSVRNPVQNRLTAPSERQGFGASNPVLCIGGGKGYIHSEGVDIASYTKSETYGSEFGLAQGLHPHDPA